MFDQILVPAGAEYQAVRRGLGPLADRLLIRAIPIGPGAATRYLAALAPAPPGNVLLLGLCGSLMDRWAVGDVLVYRDCLDLTTAPDPRLRACAPELVAWICQQLAWTEEPVRAVTSDRLVATARAKQHLHQQWAAAAVDMEGYAILEWVQHQGGRAAMVRVVSDTAQEDIPNLEGAIGPAGNLRPVALALGLLRQPVAALRLIRGSLGGLHQLEQVTHQLFRTAPLPAIPRPSDGPPDRPHQ